MLNIRGKLHKHHLNPIPIYEMVQDFRTAENKLYKHQLLPASLLFKPQNQITSTLKRGLQNHVIKTKSLIFMLYTPYMACMRVFDLTLNRPHDKFINGSQS
jgi:hypothetical protein